MEFSKPHVCVSRCLGFAATRYNGLMLSCEWVDKLRPFVHFVDVCPEVEIGLGIPRNPIRVVLNKNGFRLQQPATGLDVTDTMNGYLLTTAERLKNIDGFILKSRSPSCGLNDVKLYSGAEGEMPSGKTHGFFGGYAKTAYPNAAIEDEGRLYSFKLREHFYTKLFINADYRNAETTQRVRALVDFHSRNKLLLMSYNQTQTRLLGKITANHGDAPSTELFASYRKELTQALQAPPTRGNAINTLMHAIGYFKDTLNPKEKAFILDSFEEFRQGAMPLSVPQKLIRSLALRTGQEYLLSQTFFNPYPAALITISDSGKGTGQLTFEKEHSSWN